MNDNVAQAIRERHFEPCFEMLTDIINICPQDLWDGRSSHPPIWQNVCHALAGTWVWFRPAGQPFQEPPMGEEVAELKVIPEQPMSKQEIMNFAAEAKARADGFFAMAAGEEMLLASYSFYAKVTNLDVIMGQIRHIQHHVGYCNNILGETGTAVPWKGTRR